MHDAEQVVGRLTDVQAISLAKRLNTAIYSAVPAAVVNEHVSREIDDVDVLIALGPDARKQSLDPAQSIKMTRELLAAFARDPKLAPLLMHEWDALSSDDSLFTPDTFVYLGLVVNLALLLATTELEYKKGAFKLVKRTADAKIVRELMKPLVELAKKATGRG